MYLIVRSHDLETAGATLLFLEAARFGLEKALKVNDCIMLRMYWSEEQASTRLDCGIFLS